MNFDGALAAVSVNTYYERLHVLLGAATSDGEHDGLAWEGPSLGANPYDPHEIGTLKREDGDVVTFLICNDKIDVCQMHMEAVGGAITVDFSIKNQTGWSDIATGMRRLFLGWEN